MVLFQDRGHPVVFHKYLLQVLDVVFTTKGTELKYVCDEHSHVTIMIDQPTDLYTHELPKSVDQPIKSVVDLGVPISNQIILDLTVGVSRNVTVSGKVCEKPWMHD